MLTIKQFVDAYLNILQVITNPQYKVNFSRYLKTKLKELGHNKIIVDTSTTIELLNMFFDTVGLDVKSEEHIYLKGVVMALLEEDKVFLNKLAEGVNKVNK